jgi:hydrogenase maturation protease
MSSARDGALVIGLGNAARSDDAAGLSAARRLRERGRDAREHEGDPTALIELWRDAGEVIVVDAVRSGAAPGTIRRVDATAAPLPASLRTSTSTHAVGLADAIELARALGRLPRQVVVYGIEGERFAAGTGLTPAVAAAVDAVVEELA